jgi:hypothetical protein
VGFNFSGIIETNATTGSSREVIDTDDIGPHRCDWHTTQGT